MKAGTPSAFGERLHTTAYTPKQEPSLPRPQHSLELPAKSSPKEQPEEADARLWRVSAFSDVAAPLGCAASSAIWRCCFFRSAFGTFCMCEARGVSPLSACSTCRRNAGRPLVKTTNLLFPWSDRFFFDSSSTKYYPFFFTDTGRTSGRPAGSFAFVCISLTCPDRPDRGT